MTPETRRKVIARSGFFCIVCNKPLQHKNNLQVAHRIHKGRQAEDHIMAFIWNNYRKDRSRKWVRDNILENQMNLVAVCSPPCNDKINIFFKVVERDELLIKILDLVIND